MTQRNWPEEIEYLLQTNHLTLTALADRLGVKKQQLSLAKNGGACPPMLKFKIMDMKGYTMTREALLELLPAEVAAVIREKDNDRIAQMSTHDNDEKVIDA
ncbi:hypothetical protein [Thiobacillus denitrificans]|uniref:hypothetical protein n=1 Tax=Thiobacillus denitrificans TaxID=36861 RepID=UPI00035D590E|nr:hypothetical protein [Thiobacillus denitrificans]